MTKRAISVREFAIVWLLLQLFCLAPGLAQTAASTSDANLAGVASAGQEAIEVESIPPGDVVIEGRHILRVYEPVSSLSPAQRAEQIGKRILLAAKNGVITAESTHIEERSGWSEILVGDQMIMGVTDLDAKMAGESRSALSSEYASRIFQAIQTYQTEHSWRLIFQGIFKTVGLTVILLPLLWVIRKVRFSIRRRILRRIKKSAHLARKTFWNVTIAYLGPFMLAIGALLRWLLVLAMIEIYLTVTLGFFAATREISLTMTRWVLTRLGLLGEAVLNYLPNLLVLIVIVIVVYYVIRLLRLIFGEIRRGSWEVPGFYPDWADPTEKLIRALILISALVITFPYLPGAKSDAFKGISIFVGILLSLGSTSAVANAIAGIILTYMRSYLVGDWVQIGDATGEVVEKTVLVTRLLTPKAEIVTIPNATVMNGYVKNFSTEANKAGVIFHTTVTIGYDAPWKTVHELLVNAALATNNVLKQPAPFVLQSALNDFFVSYELNAYTSVPREMLNIFSDLHQNIQDRFNEAGVEICSPHFSALRDGNSVTTPSGYRKPDYYPPGFRVDVRRNVASTEDPPHAD